MIRLQHESAPSREAAEGRVKLRVIICAVATDEPLQHTMTKQLHVRTCADVPRRARPRPGAARARAAPRRSPSRIGQTAAGDGGRTAFGFPFAFRRVVGPLIAELIHGPKTLIRAIPGERPTNGIKCHSPPIPSPLFSIEIPKHVNYVIYWHAPSKPEKRPYVGDRHRLSYSYWKFTLIYEKRPTRRVTPVISELTVKVK